MIKRYLLTAKKDEEIKNEIFFEMNSAEHMQIAYIENGYKTQIVPLSIDLSKHEIEYHYQMEIEKEDIYSDFCYILKENYNVSDKDFTIIQEDIGYIYNIFQKCQDANLSHWENIRRVIDELKDFPYSNYDYSKID